MGLFNIRAQKKEWEKGVRHCTLNPNGPGVVRIHLVPPRFRWFRRSEYIVILNGYYLLPLGYSWAVLLSRFMEEVNRYDGKPITEADRETIAERAVRATARVYRFVGKESIRADLEEMLNILFSVAHGGKPDAEIEKLSLRAYAPNMTAPHRMDLMVSAMTDENGQWKCNQKCRFCYAAGQTMSASAEMTTAQWREALDRLRAAGVPMVTFTGGEPTLREDLPELVDYAKWFVTRLNTNGAALTPELVGKLREASLDSVQITLYSDREDIHNELTGSRHFADTVRGIENAVAGGLDVSVNTPLCRRNSDYLSTLRFIRSKGVRFVTVSGLICTGNAAANHETDDLSGEALFEIVREAKAFCDENGMEMDFTSPGLIETEKLESLGLHVPMCGAALSNMAIAPDGTVIPCQSWLNGSASLGNVLTDPFAKIWEHDLCRRLRGMNDAEATDCPFRKGDAEHG